MRNIFALRRWRFFAYLNSYTRLPAETYDVIFIP